MYQIYAYVKKLRVTAGMLLYPDIDDREYGTFFSEDGDPASEDVKIPLYIISVILSSVHHTIQQKTTSPPTSKTAKNPCTC
jgi:hypothetical protein